MGMKKGVYASKPLHVSFPGITVQVQTLRIHETVTCQLRESCRFPNGTDAGQPLLSSISVQQLHIEDTILSAARCRIPQKSECRKTTQCCFVFPDDTRLNLIKAGCTHYAYSTLDCSLVINME